MRARIGIDTSGSAILANGSSGVYISGAASNNLIGGSLLGESNLIRGNVEAGVWVEGTGTGNTIDRNAIFENGGLGIDLGTTGVDTNDVGDVDAGANGLLNYPVLGQAQSSDGITAQVEAAGAPRVFENDVGARYDEQHDHRRREHAEAERDGHWHQETRLKRCLEDHRR